uniref:Uncharacterized protein n=1 Tax=Glossina austeni TaxID=7395 RepID=A0A1A9V086_GLOAU
MQKELQTPSMTQSELLYVCKYILKYYKFGDLWLIVIVKDLKFQIYRAYSNAFCSLQQNTWRGTYRKIRLNINNRNSDDDEVDHSTNQILIELCTRTYLKLKPTCKMYFTIEGPPTYVGPSPLNYLLLTLLEKLKTDWHGKAGIFKYQITDELTEGHSEPYTDSGNVTNEKIDPTYLHDLIIEYDNTIQNKQIKT